MTQVLKNVGYVYGLSDPKTGKTHYVGETTQTLMARLGGHIQAMLDGRSSTAKNKELKEWISGLITAGLSPRIYLLEEIILGGDQKVDKRTLWDAEQRWKKVLRERGEPLMNKVPGVKKGHVFEPNTGPRKLKGRKRPELAAKLREYDMTDEHRAAVSQGQRERARRMKESGEWNSPEQRVIRSAKVRASWLTRARKVVVPEGGGEPV